MMDWDKLRVFHAVAEAGSFTRAGEKLSLSQSAVSRQISALEQSLNLPLFHRHARGLVLTEQGEILHEAVREVFARLATAEVLLSESREQPKGPLTVTTTTGFGSTWLTPRIREFLDIYPELALRLVLDDRELDLSMREADVAIRMAPPRQPDLIQRHLMTVHFHLYASKDYAERAGLPETAADLDDHKLVIFGKDVWTPLPDINWLLDVGATPGRPRRPVLQINNVYGIYEAVKSGLGIAALPDYLVERDENMVRVLPDMDGPTAEAYFVYPEVLRHSKRIAVFRDFLIRRIADTRF